MWAQFVNDALARAGHKARVDHRSLSEQGLDQEPITYSRASIELGKRKLPTPQTEEMVRRRTRNGKREQLQKGKTAAYQPLPIPDIYVDHIDDVLAPDLEDNVTQRREIEREITRARYRNAAQAERATAAATQTAQPPGLAKPHPATRRRE